MIGTVIKIHSDFYYVKTDQNIFECKVREIIKKEKITIYVGDFVRIEEINPESNQAVIVELRDRINFIPRPAIANIDQVVVTAALNQPALDFCQLDRYLAQAKLYNIPACICINKSDMSDKNNLIDQIINIYSPLKYDIVFTSTLTGEGIDKFKNMLVSKRSVLCGMSGIGKSSLLNAIKPGLNLKINDISTKSLRGVHTTRHVELIDINIESNKVISIADTPGFSHLKFDNILPENIDMLFDEIACLSMNCHFDNCSHTREMKCNILNNIDKIAPSRYESYKAFLNEAISYKQKLTYTGHKVEEKFKTIDTKDKEKIKIIKLGTQSREKSRKTNKQELNSIFRKEK